MLLSCSVQSLGPLIRATSCGSFKLHPFFPPSVCLVLAWSTALSAAWLTSSCVFLSTPGQVGFQVQLLRLFCLDTHNSARNTHGHPVKSLLCQGHTHTQRLRSHREQIPEEQRNKTPRVSLDAANDESYNISETPRMQNPRPLGLTDTTGEVHTAYSSPYKLPADSGKGCGMVISSFLYQGCLYIDEQNLGQDFSCGS